MTDDEALDVILAIQEAAIVIRDEDQHSVIAACERVLRVAHGDPIAALTVACALIPINQPTDTWWQDPAVLVKVCSDCGERKPIDEFGHNAARGDGYTYDCLICRRRRNRRARRTARAIPA